MPEPMEPARSVRLMTPVSDMAPWSWVGLAFVASSLGGCGPSQSELELLQGQVRQLKERVATLSAERDEAISERDRLRRKWADLTTEARDERLQRARERLRLEVGQEIGVRILTRLGTIECALWPQEAPDTVVNFVGLAEGGLAWTDPRDGRERHDPLYAGTTFHRVVGGFMVQGGDPLGTGAGGPGFTFADELVDEVRFDEPGRLAMANAGPDTNGSQFFITARSAPELDGKHTIFGHCEDLTVVREMMKQPLAPRGREKSAPVDPVRIDSMVVLRL